jgi:uncharacterized circularly permuted ATP-grasp superfamily protein
MDIDSTPALFEEYLLEEGCYDEVFAEDGEIRKHYKALFKNLDDFDVEKYNRLNESAKLSFLLQGITFATYNENNEGIERIFPFDLFPRIISKSEWKTVETGVLQRNHAINLFLQDLYNEKKILKSGILPIDLIFSCGNYLKQMMDFTPGGGIYNHISGTDIIKHNDGDFYILEDNVRCPSGVSYVLSNREALKRTFSDIYKKLKVQSVMNYAEELFECMRSVAPEGVDEPVCAILTPGIHNSAYYEHAFLAQSMGVQLVEGRDLFVENGFMYMKTIYGKKKLDVLYRRVDDDYIDPITFNPDSSLGVPGLMNVYREGNITLMNAPGTGVADDKAVYIYMPEIIRYYLDEEPILNNVRTYRCEKADDMKYILENIHELVVKPVDMSGGYGIFIGIHATKKETEEMKLKIKNNPRSYIAQPVMSLSLHATYIEDSNSFEPRHVDLRTFTLLGKNKEYVLKGGLSRVALKKGSLIVNSSQGGGSKDTWVI